MGSTDRGASKTNKTEATSYDAVPSRKAQATRLGKRRHSSASAFGGILMKELVVLVEGDGVGLACQRTWRGTNMNRAFVRSISIDGRWGI